MEPNAYYALVMPHARTAAGLTGIPAALIAAFWSWETAFGTNHSSINGNNHGGIKANSKGRDGVVGQYAAYNSIDRFARDWARILTSVKGVGYEAVIETARRTSDPVAITKVFNASAYAEADYNVDTIVRRYKDAGGQVGTGSTVTPMPDAGGGGGRGAFTLPDISDLSDADMRKYAAIGLAAVALIALMR